MMLYDYTTIIRGVTYLDVEMYYKTSKRREKMMNLIPTLMLLLGWVFNLEDLIMASFCVSLFFILIFFISHDYKNDKIKNFFTFETIFMFIIFVLAMIKLTNK